MRASFVLDDFLHLLDCEFNDLLCCAPRVCIHCIIKKMASV